jgi:hypothetical protein
MKLHVRLFLTIPFVIVVFGYYNIFNPDEVCIGGPIDQIIILIAFSLLIVTGILALVATLRKKHSDKPTPEPISLSISLITLLFLIYDLTFRGHTKGDEWIYAENKDIKQISFSQNLTLRKNGNFTVGLTDPYLDCSFSGKYKKVGDTIILDKEIISKTSGKLAAIYLLQSDKIVPLVDTTNKIVFTVSEIN